MTGPMEAPVGLPVGRSYVSGGLGTSLQKTHPDKIGQSGKNHSVTGRNLYLPVQAAKTVGMNEHIAKPFDLNMLARMLDKWPR